MLSKACRRCAWGFVLLQSAIADAQHPQHDFVFFASTQASDYSGVETNTFQESEFTPALDIVYSRMRDRFHLFGELLLTDYEEDLERFQLGWQLSEGTSISFGRFHDPAGLWNMEYHHGQFLQPSVFRPAIEEFEDLGGVLPMHTTGVLLERRDEIGSSALRTSLSGGLSGRFTGTQLEPFDLVDPESGHGTGLTARLALYPDALGDNAIGLALSRHDVALEDGVVLPTPWDPLSTEIRLDIRDLFLTWNWDKWRLLGSIMRVETRANGGAAGEPYEFTAAYGQVEFAFRPRWRAYGRMEDVSGDQPYLDLFPAFVGDQVIVGARWAIASRQALTFEATHADFRGDRFHRYSVQWSSAFP